MRSVQLCAAVAALLSCAAHARNLPSLDQQPKVVQLQTKRNIVTSPLSRDRLRRRGSLQTGLSNEETLYYINTTIGTPAQSIRLQIDTGSSDLWVNTPSSDECSASSSPCASTGTYSANDSSTYEYVGSWFNISYVDGSSAGGDYAKDTVTIGSTTLDQLQFGIGYTSSTSQGILGIGYPSNEVQVGRAGKTAYNNLPAALVSAGSINRNAYSLWLNDLDSSTGSILFGGIDTAQYTGDLSTLPIQTYDDAYSEFLITLTGLSFGNTSIATDEALAVLLDSGSTLTYLPDSWAQSIYNQVDAQYDSSSGVAYVVCSLRDSARALKFTFSSPSITVTMDELVIDITSGGQPLKFADGQDACLFGIAPAGSSTSVLGDTFLRSAYVVYDIANNEISIAQTTFNATTTSIQEIPTGTSLPGATFVSDSVKATGGVSSSSGISAGSGDYQNAAPSVVASASVLSSCILVGVAIFGAFML
ncbi:eukaryotic aspartyl protease [Xylariaceae sp. FL1272]|nr:eukaryotic aspartyl protease [Xylariaceae sp. FL1272]